MSNAEYPDEVVANFLLRVRSLPVEHDQPTWASRRHSVLAYPEWRRRLIGMVAIALHASSLWFGLHSSLWLAQPRSARRAYRVLFRDLKAAGWRLERRATIGQALYAIRSRSIGATAVRLYESTMQSRIPRQSLGWM